MGRRVPRATTPTCTVTMRGNRTVRRDLRHRHHAADGLGRRRRRVPWSGRRAVRRAGATGRARRTCCCAARGCDAHRSSSEPVDRSTEPASAATAVRCASVTLTPSAPLVPGPRLRGDREPAGRATGASTGSATPRRPLVDAFEAPALGRAGARAGAADARPARGASSAAPARIGRIVRAWRPRRRHGDDALRRHRHRLGHRDRAEPWTGADLDRRRGACASSTCTRPSARSASWSASTASPTARTRCGSRCSAARSPDSQRPLDRDRPLRRARRLRPAEPARVLSMHAMTIRARAPRRGPRAVPRRARGLHRGPGRARRRGCATRAGPTTRRP